MNRIILVLLTVGSLMLPLQGQSGGPALSDNFEYVTVFQNGREAESLGDTFYIDRDSFELVFSYKGPINLLIGASTTSESYDVFKYSADIEGAPVLAGTGMAEGLKNDQLNITLSKDSPSAWFYEDEEMNRFDKNESMLSGLVSTRTVENITVQRGETKAVKQSGISELYICVAEYEYKDRRRQILIWKAFKIVLR